MRPVSLKKPRIVQSDKATTVEIKGDNENEADFHRISIDF